MMADRVSLRTKGCKALVCPFKASIGEKEQACTEIRALIPIQEEAVNIHGVADPASSILDRII